MHFCNKNCKAGRGPHSADRRRKQRIEQFFLKTEQKCLIKSTNFAKIARYKFIGVSPSGKATDSDSVIRWFESSYPSHRYHILYKECASEYNIWFLFYMAIFTLPQIGERNGVKTRTKFWKESLFFACFARNSGLFCYVFASSKMWFGERFVSKRSSPPL